MIFSPQAASVDHWFVAFFPDARHWLVRLIPGRFKHVALFARVPDMRAWVWIEYTLWGFDVHVFPDTEAGRTIVFSMADGAGLICVKARKMERPRVRMGLTCVGLAAQALGLGRGAVSPDGLWRKLLTDPNARVVNDGIFEAEATRGDRGRNSGAESAAAIER